MERDFHLDIFKDGEWKVGSASPLNTMAQLNPVACARYADALLKELDDATIHCTIGDAATPLVDAYKQIHALKNTVAATGCPSLLAACGSLQANASGGLARAEAESVFLHIARATRRLILGFRGGILGREPGPE